MRATRAVTSDWRHIITGPGPGRPAGPGAAVPAVQGREASLRGTAALHPALSRARSRDSDPQSGRPVGWAARALGWRARRDESDPELMLSVQVFSVAWSVALAPEEPCPGSAATYFTFKFYKSP